MRDYDELVKALRACQSDYCHRCGYNHNGCVDKLLPDAADAIEELQVQINGWIEQERKSLLKSVPCWISVEEPPNNDRNIFICHGSVDFKAPCIGHYDPGMKLFYEDVNWVSSPIYDAMFWCEMPKLPLPVPPKEDA